MPLCTILWATSSPSRMLKKPASIVAYQIRRTVMEETRTHRVVKRGELAIRRAFITFLSRRSLKSSPTLPLQLPDSPTILILRQDRFGDAIITTPLLVALKERYPTARIMVLLGKKIRASHLYYR